MTPRPGPKRAKRWNLNKPKPVTDPVEQARLRAGRDTITTILLRAKAVVGHEPGHEADGARELRELLIADAASPRPTILREAMTIIDGNAHD